MRYFRNLVFSNSDDDLGAIIAYLKSLPPVDSELPANKLGPLGRVLLVTNAVPVIPAEMIDHTVVRPAVIEPGVTVEYGEYLVQTCKSEIGTRRRSFYE